MVLEVLVLELMGAKVVLGLAVLVGAKADLVLAALVVLELAVLAGAKVVLVVLELVVLVDDKAVLVDLDLVVPKDVSKARHLGGLILNRLCGMQWSLMPMEMVN